MINVTVKTMDSQSRQFEVPDPTKIKDFKDKIAPSVNVDASNQRLIFQGRVLPDDFELTQEHNGKVLHLVQRMPAITTASSSASSTTTTASTTRVSSTGINTGGAFNPSQLSQMIFQQAMNGLGSLLAGGSISGNMMANPNNPNEQIMNIQIDVNGASGGGGGGATATSTSSSSSTSSSTPTVTVQTRGTGSRPRENFSAPRQLLRVVERNMIQLESALNQLETNLASAPAPENTPVQESTARDVEVSGDVFASELEHGERPDEAMEVSTDEASEPAGPSSNTVVESTRASQGTSTARTSSTPRVASSGSGPTCTNHPSLGELGTYYTRMLQAQHRLEPFINRMITFLNTDPAYNSTQSPEFRRTARSLTLTLQAQQLLAEIQRRLCSVVIPLGRTPPRTMFVRGPSAPPLHHHHHVDARRLHHAVHAGMASFGTPRGAIFTSSQTSGGASFRPGGPPPFIPIGGIVRPRVIPVAQGVQVRWRAPSSTAQASVANAGTAITSTAANTGATGATTPTASAGSTVRSQSSSAGTGGSNTSGMTTVFSVQPPTYSVQVNATIQPHILINVSSENTTASTATTVTTSTTSSRTRTTSRSQTNTHQQQPSQNTQANTTWTTAGNIPNIPGVQPDVLSNLFQSVAQSVQQQLPANQSGSSRPNTSGVILVQGPAGGENQVPEDISNIIGQTVFDAVYNQLTGANQSISSQAGSLPHNVRVFASTPATITSSSAAPTTMWSSTPSTTTSSSAAPTTTAAEAHPVQSSRSNESVKSEDFQSATSVQIESASASNKNYKSRDQTRNTQLRDIIERLRNSRVLSTFNWDQPSSGLISMGPVESTTDLTPQNLLRLLLMQISTRYSCKEVLETLQGDAKLLRRLRGIVSDLISRCYFDGAKPKPDKLQLIAGRISEAMRESIAHFFADARVHVDIDAVESNLSLMRHVLKKALEIIFFTDDSLYPEELSKHFQYWISMWVRLNESILRSGRKGLVLLLKKFQPLQEGFFSQLMSAVEEAFKTEGDSSSFENLLQSLSYLYSGTQDEIDQFVLSAAPNEVESDTVLDVDGGESEKMDTNTPETRESKPKPSVPRSSAGPVDGNNTACKEKGDDDSWKKEVPSEWVETIVRDGEAQSNMEPQLPFSDAYMSGMPASKRRKVVS